jgi:outer membrane protein OmpA-like peptidoglycan-associated protein/subtilisin family serine protease
MGPDLWELYEYGEADDEVAAIIRLAHFGALPPGVRVISQFEEIITVRLNRGDIPKISGAPETSGMSSGDGYLGADLEYDAVDSESLPPRTAIDTDHRRPDDLAMTGRGIVIGVVDWGFDFRHPDFRRADGSSRILALWDQRGGKQAKSPQPYGYGVLHTREDINKALAEKDPYATLHYHPADADTGTGCHGTHVASIAAGTGGDGRPAGIAPEADLVFVHNAPWDGLEAGKLGDSVTLLEAIDFIARTAAGRPWVINLSMGRHGEQHDGTTLIEQGLDAAVRTAAGRAICMSAGNYYNKRTHASGHLRPTQKRSLAWVVNEKNPSDYNQLEVWYSWQDKFEVAVKSPDDSIVATARLGEKVKLIAGGKEIGNLYHRAQEPNTLDHHVTIYLYKTAPPGEWVVTLTGTDVIHGNYHCWIEREVSCPKCQSHFKTEDADPTSTTGTICNGRRTIAVGAYDAHDPGHRIGAFSSVGPTRDGRLKPDLCAPGVSVLAARSAQREHPDATPLVTRMSGTSMASPFVAGACACAFQAAVRPLRIEETHNLLLGSARRVTVEDRDPDRVGIGFADVAAFVDAAGRVDNGQRTFVPVRETSGAAVKPERESVDVHRPHAGGLQPMVEGESLRPTPGLHLDAGDSEALGLTGVGDEGGRRKRAAELVGDPTPIDAESEEAEAVAEAVLVDPDRYLLTSDAALPVIPEPEPAEPLDLRAFLELLSAGASARDLFDVFAHGAERPRAATFRERFELVAAPRASLGADIRAGDVLVRCGGGQGYVGVLTSAPLSIENAIARGLSLERWQNGYFAPVIEPAALARMMPSSLARQLADAGGMLPHNQIVLRPRRVPNVIIEQAADAAEDDGPTSPGCRILDQFPVNHAELQPAHPPILARAAQDILSGHIAAVRIVGHASQDGTQAYNDTIARQRANNVAAALRGLIESGHAGASAGITFTVETRGEHEPVSQDPARNRRVQICFVPGVAPPLPSAGLEAPLRALLTASMTLAGNHTAPFTPGALPVARVSGALWSYNLQFGTSGSLEARQVTCRVMHTMPGPVPMTHLMPSTVLDYVRWEDPTITLPGVTGAITLPIRASYLLGSFDSSSGHIGAASHPHWRLESGHEHGTAIVFGYDISDPGRPRPLTRAEDIGRSWSGSGRATRVLVVCELVVCQSRADFEPLGVLDAGRIYPIAQILTDAQGADLQMTVDLRRPDNSSMEHGWLNPRHIPSLYTDRNFDQGALGDLSLAFTGSAAPVPTWDDLFDYFDRNAARAAISAVAVNPALTGARSDSTNRSTWNRAHSRYDSTTVIKRPRQGEFDNVHIAPQMAASLPATTVSIPTLPPVPFPGFGPVGVSMAPICAHDCFHMHWRWGWGFRHPQNMGFGARGPNSEPGAPMVPLNQKIKIEIPAGHAGIRYEATAYQQHAAEWAVIMHHGAAFALRVNIDPLRLIDRIMPIVSPVGGIIVHQIRNWITAHPDTAWAWVYFFFQYWPQTSAPFFRENVMIHNLTTLRRL